MLSRRSDITRRQFVTGASRASGRGVHLLRAHGPHSRRAVRLE
jgi:hypothetical protein